MGKMLGAQIDACWQQSCSAQCNDLPVTGKDQGPASGNCQQPVLTPAEICSQCTVDHCCAVWNACFGNNDCVALNQCSVACYKT